MKLRTIKFEESEPGIGLITLNRPDRLNALSMDIVSRLCNLCGVGFEPVNSDVVAGKGGGQLAVAAAEVDHDSALYARSIEDLPGLCRHFGVGCRGCAGQQADYQRGEYRVID